MKLLLATLLLCWPVLAGAYTNQTIHGTAKTEATIWGDRVINPLQQVAVFEGLNTITNGPLEIRTDWIFCHWNLSIGTNAVTTRIDTNVVETSNGKSGCPYAGTDAMCLVMGCNHSASIPATEKKIITEVVEIKTLTLEWEGKKEVIEHRRVLEHKERKLVKKEQWEEK